MISASRTIVSKASSSGRNRWLLSSDNSLPYLLLVPAIVALGCILVLPLIYNIWLSFHEYNLLRPARNTFVGFENYFKVIQDPAHLSSLFLTVRFTAITVLAEVILGTSLALLLNLPFPGNHFVRTLVLVPMLISEVVAGLSWRLIYHTEFGLLNYLIGLFGLSPQVWLGPDLALPSVMIVEIWQHTPFVTLIMLAGLQTVPRELLESSTIDGASRWQRFRYVVLPLITPILLLALVFRTMFTLRVFTPVWVLTGGGPADSTLVIGVDIYRAAFRYYNLGTAATLSIILLAVTLAITLVYMRLLRREALT
jgi:multiple sugar transport system permease protein